MNTGGCTSSMKCSRRIRPAFGRLSITARAAAHRALISSLCAITWNPWGGTSKPLPRGSRCRLSSRRHPSTRKQSGDSCMNKPPFSQQPAVVRRPRMQARSAAIAFLGESPQAGTPSALASKLELNFRPVPPGWQRRAVSCLPEIPGTLHRRWKCRIPYPRARICR
jgi:hypothetical protein